jgi:hypothetical protein
MTTLSGGENLFDENLEKKECASRYDSSTSRPGSTRVLSLLARKSQSEALISLY